LIIAIDGPAGSGKSSTARVLAEKLGMIYLDTGAMYRAAALAVLNKKVDPADKEKAAAVVRDITISFSGSIIFLNNMDVSLEIRKDSVNKAVTPVSANSEVRRIMVDCQRRIGADQDIVVEGRDIGTVVFPGADFKFFMTADIRTRAKRRLKETTDDLTLDEVMNDIRRRDEKDSSREYSPLRKADDAVEIDTSTLSFKEQIDKILSYIQ